MRRKRTCFALLLTTFVVTVMTVGRAAAVDVVLKPNGREAAPLRLKTLAAKVHLEAAQFATTDLDLTFQNELSERIEADFIYTVPKGAVVTDFAYFYGDERVPARIAEKERAAAIYRNITSRMQDPALVEMIGKNTFRARIFPVMPDADLRVQIRYVETLPLRAGGHTVTYSLPLKSRKQAQLDHVSVDFDTSPLETRMRLTNNYGLPIAAGSDGGSQLSFSGSQYRTDEDLRVTLNLPKSELQAHCLAARSGGPDGFFALALTAAGSARLRPASVRLAGISPYDVETAVSGAGLLVSGRYRGSGQARASVVDAAGKTLTSAPLTFGDRSEANNPASKIWAASRITRLSGSAKNRAAVVALSSRFTLPSKWTSWIAIPTEERQRYAREKVEADSEPIVQQLTRLTERGQGKSPEADRLRARFYALYRSIGEDGERTLHQQLEFALSRYVSSCVTPLANRLADLIVRGKGDTEAARRLHAQYLAECRTFPDVSTTGEQDFHEALQAGIEQRGTWPLAQHLVRLMEAGQGKSPAADRLRAEFLGLYQAIGEDGQAALKNDLSNGFYNRALQLAHDEAHAVAANGSQSPSALHARAQLSVVSRLYREHATGFVDPVEQEVGIALWSEQRERISRLVDSVLSGRDNPRAERALWRELYHLAPAMHQKNSDVEREYQNELRSTLQEDATGWAESEHRESLYWQWDNEVRRERAAPLSEEERRRLKTAITRLARALHLSFEDALEMGETPWRRKEMVDLRNQIITARKEDPVDTAQVNALETRFLADARSDRQKALGQEWRYYYQSNTPENREAFARDRLARIAARTEGEQIDALLHSPPKDADLAVLRSRRDALQKTEDELRARMGDPLLSVEAPADARAVVARMPEGSTLPLAWNPTDRKWEARFDIPTTAAEGAYDVLVTILLRDGRTRRTTTFRYNVDVTPPQGTATVTRLADGTLRLEVDASADTARVVALLPGGAGDSAESAALPLHAVEGRPGHFFALAGPSSLGAGDDPVTFILTDRAHNRTVLTAAAGESHP